MKKIYKLNMLVVLLMSTTLFAQQTPAKKQNESIHLIDYRGIIPQEIIQSGNNFDTFVELLLKTILKISGIEKV